MAFTVYLLECADGTLYVGHTDNLDLRMHQHDLGIKGCYTSTRRPLRLLHAEAFETRYEAIVIERKLDQVVAPTTTTTTSGAPPTTGG